MGSIIEVKNIYKTYGDLHVVHNIIMKVQRGDIYDTVKKEGWGGIRARDAGNMVKRAIEMAEESVKKGNS